MTKILCPKCDGYFILKDGKFGTFAGCSNFPKCKETKKIYQLVLDYIKNNGINIYKWEKNCWKCKQNTSVFSYFLTYELQFIDEYFNMAFGTIGLGDIFYVDKLLSEHIPTIKRMYSNTTKSYSIANTCEHCGALQGRNFVVDDPHEIMNELFSRGMNKYYYATLPIEDISNIEKGIKYLFTESD